MTGICSRGVERLNCETNRGNIKNIKKDEVATKATLSTSLTDG